MFLVKEPILGLHTKPIADSLGNAGAAAARDAGRTKSTFDVLIAALKQNRAVARE